MARLENIVKALEEDIIFKVLSPQARLVEELISTRFKVKRHLVREAFFRLKEMGLINRVPNKGVLVKELAPQEAQDLYEMRELLELSAVERMKLPVSRDLIDQMETVFEQLCSAVREEDFRKVYHLNIEFHQLQFSICSNLELVNLVSKYARQAKLISFTLITHDTVRYKDRMISQHRLILDAMKGSDKNQLVKAVREHLAGVVEGYIKIYEIRYGKRII